MKKSNPVLFIRYKEDSKKLYDAQTNSEIAILI